MLLDNDLTVAEIAKPFTISLAAISKHIAVLSQAGLLVRIRNGRTTICMIEPNALLEASAWMEGFGHFDASDLENLERLFAQDVEYDDCD